MATILTVTPNTLLDHLAEVGCRPGVVQRVERFVPVAGGKGMNMARVLARHGHRVVAVGFAGGWSGGQLAALVAADGVEAALVPTRARTRLGFQAIAPDGGRATAVLEDGFEVTPDEVEAFVAEVRRRLAEAALVLVGGSVPHAAATGVVRRTVELCATAGVPCWVDSYGPAMREALAAPARPLVVKPNREELAEGGEAWLACPEVHVSDGPREVLVRLPDRSYRVGPPAVREINPIGSGDCYLAGLAHARLAGLPFEAQLRYAAAAGAANAARADVAWLGPSDIEPLVDAVRVELA